MKYQKSRWLLDKEKAERQEDKKLLMKLIFLVAIIMVCYWGGINY